MSALALALLAATATPSPAASGAPPPPKAVTTIDGKPVTPRPATFIDGEELVLVGSWGWVTGAGTMTLTVQTNATFDGQPAIHLEMKAKTTGSGRMLLNIDDAGDSWVDPTGIYSLGFVSDQVEGNISDYQRWELDYEKGVATRDRTRRKAEGPVKRTTTDYPLTATHVQDPASMFFFFRAFDLEVGQTLATKVFVSRKVWDLEVTAVSKEKVKVPAGKFDCLKVRPKVSLGGKVQKRGESTIWVTDDERKMPVKIVIQLPIGRATFELKKYAPKLD